MLYRAFFSRLEKARWSMESDIPWHAIEKDRVGKEEVAFVKANALIEWTAVDATESFIRDFNHDADFLSFVSIWYYEEMKHFLALKRYVEAFGEEIDEAECGKMKLPVQPASPANILTVHCIGEFRLALWYNSLRKAFKEPVLQRIYKLIAEDEIRHGMCYYRYLKKLLSDQPRELVTVFKAALFMLRQPVHPTILTGTIAGLEGAEKVYQYLHSIVSKEDEQKTNKTIFSLLSGLSGYKVASLKDILDQLKQMRVKLRTAQAQA